MSSVGTIYGPKGTPKVLRALAAAAYNGVKLDVSEVIPLNGDGQKPEYLAKFPHVSKRQPREDALQVAGLANL